MLVWLQVAVALLPHGHGFHPDPRPEAPPEGRREAPPRPTARNALSAEGAIGWAKSRIAETRSHEERTSRNTCILGMAKTKIGSAAWPVRAKELLSNTHLK